MPIDKNCLNCKQPYRVFRLFEQAKYCSRHCFSEAKKALFKGENNPFFGKKHTKETRDEISKKMKGRPANSGSFSKEGRRLLEKDHPLWKGEQASYSAKHHWIKLKLGSPNYCQSCKTTLATRYDWHNISREYKRDLNDWIRLCRYCHYRYDRKLLK